MARLAAPESTPAEGATVADDAGEAERLLAHARSIWATKVMLREETVGTEVQALKRACRLPETGDELAKAAEVYNANSTDLLLRGRATEHAVKRLSESGELARYRVLHFATHGLLDSEARHFGACVNSNSALKQIPPFLNASQLDLPIGSAAALLLSPPQLATEEDDGLLTASEIIGLKLNADWVILSACNTRIEETDL